MSVDPSGDSTADTSADGRWLTYAELAKLRGIDLGSAKRLALRNHWRRQKGNSGRAVKVLVPPEALGDGLTADASVDATTDVTTDRSADISRLVSALEAAIASLTERAQAAEAGRGRAEAQATELRGEIEVLQAQLAGHQDALRRAETLEAADAARRAQGRWARLRAAWRGE